FAAFKKKTERESSIRPSFDYMDKFDFVDVEYTDTMPTLADLGFTAQEIAHLPDTPRLKGGETEARQRLHAFVSNASDMESSLSPWLTQGCISIHEVYFAVDRQKAL